MFSSTPSSMLQVCFMCRAPCGERSLGEGPGDVKGGEIYQKVPALRKHLWDHRAARATGPSSCCYSAPVMNVRAV